MAIINDIEILKTFLRNKKGYLKEGKRRLRDKLRKQGFEATIKMCGQALAEVRRELEYTPSTKPEPKILFYDIEVSFGLARAWRPSYNTSIRYSDFFVHPKIICISYKWNNSDEIHTLRWSEGKNGSQDDKTLLELFIPVLNEADFIVAHNGDKFDLPWIRTRALAHGLAMYPKYESVDTLKICRKDHRFPSNRLDDVADYLGVGRKLKTDENLWNEVFMGNEEALNYMIEYCEMDVEVLEKVYNKLISMTFPKTHMGVKATNIKQSSPYSGSMNIEAVKKTTSKTGTEKWLMKDLDNGRFFEMSKTDYEKFKLMQ